MNAIEIIQQVRAHDADLFVEDQRLMVRGMNAPLPAELQRALRAHKAEAMVALGALLDRAAASVLSEIRPHLAPSLRDLPDDRLITLVNWSILAAFEAAVRRVGG
jgi:hypothetical protein